MSDLQRKGVKDINMNKKSKKEVTFERQQQPVIFRCVCPVELSSTKHEKHTEKYAAYIALIYFYSINESPSSSEGS